MCMEGWLRRGRNQDCKFYIHIATLAVKIATQTLCNPGKGPSLRLSNYPLVTGRLFWLCRNVMLEKCIGIARGREVCINASCMHSLAFQVGYFCNYSSGWSTYSLFFVFFKLVVSFFLFYFNFLFSWPSHVAGGILVPRLGIELMSLALEAQSLNHWTTRQIPSLVVNYLK